MHWCYSNGSEKVWYSPEPRCAHEAYVREQTMQCLISDRCWYLLLLLNVNGEFSIVDEGTRAFRNNVKRTVYTAAMHAAWPAFAFLPPLIHSRIFGGWMPRGAVVVYSLAQQLVTTGDSGIPHTTRLVRNGSHQFRGTHKCWRPLRDRPCPNRV